MRVLLMLQLFSTLSMAGLIWFVQVVHYPLFADVGEPEMRGYAARHATRTTWVVFPLMCVELVSAGMLLSARFRPEAVRPKEAWLGAGLVAVIWLSTGLLQVRLHDRLQTGADAKRNADAVRRLVATNWIRTTAWSGRAALVLWWTYRALAVG